MGLGKFRLVKFDEKFRCVLHLYVVGDSWFLTIPFTETLLTKIKYSCIIKGY